MNMDIQVNSVKAGRKTILHPMAITIPNGKVVAILGKNGSGKSTLINAITGHPSYEFNGTATYHSPIFVGFQKPVEIPEMTALSLLLHLDKLSHPNDYCETLETFTKRYENAIQALNITNDMLTGPLNRNISGGENKRLELLQMLVIKPQTILLDEIDTGLDLDSIILLAKLIKSYIDDHKPTVVIVTHNLIFLKQFDIHAVYILDNGRIATKGKSSLIKKLEMNGFDGVVEQVN